MAQNLAFDVCSCTIGPPNSGAPNCIPLFGVVNNAIIVPLKDKDNNRNGIDLTVTPTASTWSDLVNEPDPWKRWYPQKEMNDVTWPKADTQFKEAGSGKKAKLRPGKRSMEGYFWEEDATPEHLGKLEQWECLKFGIFYPDVNGNLIGSREGDFLYPIPIDNNSWDPRFGFPVEDDVQNIMLSYDWDRNFKERTLQMITAKSAGIDFTTLEGLQDVYFTVSAASVTDITFDAELGFGTAYVDNKFEGADQLTDWTLTNNTTALAVTIDSVTENSPGNYTISYSTGVSVGNELEIAVAKTGFEGKATQTVA